jgi:hypothetical protein
VQFFEVSAALVPLFLLTVVTALRGLGKRARKLWVELAYWSLVWPALMALWVSLAVLLGWASPGGLTQGVVFACLLWLFLWTVLVIRAQLEGVELGHTTERRD